MNVLSDNVPRLHDFAELDRHIYMHLYPYLYGPAKIHISTNTHVSARPFRKGVWKLQWPNATMSPYTTNQDPHPVQVDGHGTTLSIEEGPVSYRSLRHNEMRR